MKTLGSPIALVQVDNDPNQKGKREIILSVVCECNPGEQSRVQHFDSNIDEKEDEAQGKKGYEKKVRGKVSSDAVSAVVLVIRSWRTTRYAYFNCSRYVVSISDFPFDSS